MDAKGNAVFHRPVMVRETIAALGCIPGGRYIDGTTGGGGHSFEILINSSPDGLLVAMDVDGDAIEEAKHRLASFGSRVILSNSNFSSMRTVLSELGITKVNGILLDLGVSSHQLDSAVRGFSFSLDAPLDMRMDNKKGRNAYDLIHTLSREELERVIREYGEERMARRIAIAITRRRAVSAIRTTAELAGIVASAIPSSMPKSRIHPATRTFQAIRIVVNGELESLKIALEDGADILETGGRFCVISFHSLEDRIVKNSFSSREKGCVCPHDLPVCACGRKPSLKIITKRPVIPEESEIIANPRSRSAKLRVAERI